MKTFAGTVTSIKMDKTVVVTIERRWRHPLYRKIVKKTKNYLVHAPQKLELGELVQIQETKPLSRKKRWIVVEKNKEMKQPVEKKITRKSRKK